MSVIETYNSTESSKDFQQDPSLLPDAVSLEDKDFIFGRLLGFFDIKVLEVAVKYKFFTITQSSPSSLSNIATIVELPERSVKFILLSLIGMRLFTEKEGSYSPTEQGVRFFSEHSEFYLGSYVYYLNWLFNALPKFSEGILHDEPIWDGYNHYLKLFGEESSASNEKLMNDAMTSSQILLCHRLLNSLNLSSHHKLLDIGGGDGRFSASVITKYTHIRSTIFELPQVCQRSIQQICNWGMSERITTLSGNFEDDAWPTGHDVVSFVRIFTTRSEELIRCLIKKAFDSLPSGGRVIFADTAVLPREEKDIGPLASRLAIIYQMSSYGSVRSLTEWSDLFTDAGFEMPDLAVIDDPYGFISAVKK